MPFVVALKLRHVPSRLALGPKFKGLEPGCAHFHPVLMMENRPRRIHAHPHRCLKGEKTKQALPGVLPRTKALLCAETYPSRPRTQHT